MGLISHAAAIGIGYTLARPEGRRQLLKLRDQGRQLLQHPRVTRIEDRGRNLATQQINAVTTTVKQRLGRSTPPAPPTAPSVADAETVTPPGPRHSIDDDHPGPDASGGVAGFGGTTIEEDSKAAILGMPPLPRGGITTPTSTPAPAATPGTDT